eukprot:CAMPEP_0194232216 /NCGR_PEP_ID=MMETSP0158-20130606/667_1 /TAXON_ID=33649 /ORGANISM="Thalassionema nitzschioides, Strain L26-B" /LENGTH=725 /DNA_ID=CAMNT_0038964945 /DNA_START=43 /DNA_END=2220 /DNA_ORIENTATION=+
MSILYDGIDEFEIPELCKHATVTCKSIPKEKFKNCLSLETVILAEGVEEIGVDAFEGCAFLERIKFPSTLKRIEDNAFFGCGSLERVDLPEGLEKIGTYAFFCCHHLTAIRIPEGVKKISKEAFQCCIRLETIILPQSLEEIEKQAFMRCEALRNIKLPQNVTKLDEEIFEHCYDLEERKNKYPEFENLSMEEFLKMKTPDSAEIERNFVLETKELEKQADFEVKTFDNDQMDKMYNLVFTKDWDDYGKDSPESAEKEVVVEPTEEKTKTKDDTALEPIVEDVEDEELKILDTVAERESDELSPETAEKAIVVEPTEEKAITKDDTALEPRVEDMEDEELKILDTVAEKDTEKEDKTEAVESNFDTNLKAALAENPKAESSSVEDIDIVTKSEVSEKSSLTETTEMSMTAAQEDTRGIDTAPNDIKPEQSVDKPVERKINIQDTAAETETKNEDKTKEVESNDNFRPEPPSEESEFNEESALAEVAGVLTTDTQKGVQTNIISTALSVAEDTATLLAAISNAERDDEENNRETAQDARTGNEHSQFVRTAQFQEEEEAASRITISKNNKTHIGSAVSETREGISTLQMHKEEKHLVANNVVSTILETREEISTLQMRKEEKDLVANNIDSSISETREGISTLQMHTEEQHVLKEIRNEQARFGGTTQMYQKETISTSSTTQSNMTMTKVGSTNPVLKNWGFGKKEIKEAAPNPEGWKRNEKQETS